MADNVQLNLGAGGVIAAADDVGGFLWQRIKIGHGADGAATDVSLASPIPTRSTGATSVSANVAENLASTTLLAANANRLGWSIYNDSDSALNLNFTAAAGPTAFVKRLLPRDFTSARDFGVQVFTGAIVGIWDTTPGTANHNAARTMELTA